MTVWLAIGALTLLAVLPILWPLLRPSGVVSERLDHDLEVYRDQLREVDAELAANSLTEREAGEAKREIERRILRAADQGESRGGPAAPSALTAVLIALLLPALTLLLYTQLGQPDQPGQPLAQRAAPAPAQQGLSKGQSDEVNEMVASLEKRLQAQPDDLDGWILLGRSQAALGDFENAAKALRRAAAISGDDVELQVALGDILTRGAGGAVTPEALAVFEKARALAPRHLAVRYFLALAELQAGRRQEAYDAWLALFRELPANSENRPALAAQIRDVAQQLGIDPENELALGATSSAPAPSASLTPRAPGAPGTPGAPTPGAPGAKSGSAPGPDRAAMAAAANMPAAERQEFIASMVQRLADRLQDEPGDFDGWMRLGKAYGVLRKPAKAAAAYGRAAALRPADPAPLNAQVMALLQGAPSDQALPEATLVALRKLEVLQPDNGRVLWFLGMVDAGAGRSKAAIGRWQRLYDQLPEGSKERAGLEAAIDRLRASK